jgi:transcriptional regulator GlxA family with amidase domain
MSDGGKIKKALGQLALALLNATFLLALALTVTFWLVLGQVQNLADTTRITLVDALAPQSERLERIIISIENIEERLQSGVATKGL